MIPLSVWYETEAVKTRAEQIAERLQLPCQAEAAIQVWVSETGVGLKRPGISPVFPDFTRQTWEKRRKDGKGQGLIRACKPTPGMKILDVSAGWGRDAAILASFGAEVTMLERHPVMAVLLEDALARLDEDTQLPGKLHLINIDAHTFLQHLSGHHDFSVIYMDPMHPERQKSALVKKDLQLLQQLIGADTDALSLLQLAMEKTAGKVVVKWPQSEKMLMPAASCVPGKTIRFDVYMGKFL